MTHLLIWVEKGICAAVLTVTGTVKLLVPRERLQPHMRGLPGAPRTHQHPDESLLATVAAATVAV